ncbi:protein serine/threonine kinase, putative [Entamoeba dispar SAW760]|uniref:Protein serine/threonine kinase, putative n=1 Tax=Entamoeba dispar (strain ATCC PRA-260 / SAW760) TaxID=370354 RepID=B0EJJ9_ENTDS|nr:protein serine/threonine kinase, putative [Entamoeba dispar SAW760]EDR25321.1 protein serine/threonine kinase, putative [Entamoeba dispar SAW760]|eukprot:EDR25321.1 protein serine/threonine kinase, putative [Entamoeba dispar SAW760]
MNIIPFQWYYIFLFLSIEVVGEYCDWNKNVFEECNACIPCQFNYNKTGVFIIRNRETETMKFIQPHDTYFLFKNVSLKTLVIQNQTQSTFDLKELKTSLIVLINDTTINRDFSVDKILSFQFNFCSPQIEIQKQNPIYTSLKISKFTSDYFTSTCSASNLLRINEFISVYIGKLYSSFGYLYSTPIINNPIFNSTQYKFTLIKQDDLFHYYFYDPSVITILKQEVVNSILFTSLLLNQNNIDLYLFISSLKIYYSIPSLSLLIHSYTNAQFDITINETIDSLTFYHNNDNFTFSSLTQGFLHFYETDLQDGIIYTIKTSSSSGTLHITNLQSHIVLENLEESFHFQLNSFQYILNAQNGCQSSIISSNLFQCLSDMKCPKRQFFDEKKNICQNCSNYCSNCINSTYCIYCDDGYINRNGKCYDTNDICSSNSESSCYFCDPKNSYFIESCRDCSSHCKLCQEKKVCLQCEDNYYLNQTSQCVKTDVHQEIMVQDHIISCMSGYYLKNNQCISCSESYGLGCQICDSYQCISCSPTTVFLKGSCIIPEHCNKITNGVCVNCEGLYYSNFTSCIDFYNSSSVTNHCLLMHSGQCIVCNKNYFRLPNGTCSEYQTDHCVEPSELGCFRCEDGFFLDLKGYCVPCIDNCRYCANSTHCLQCKPHHSLTNSLECLNASQLNDNCELITSFGNGCVVCKKGYYRYGLDCTQCNSSCLSCQNLDSCLECKDGYLMNKDAKCIALNETIGCINTTSEHIGCDKCAEGYYLEQYECVVCPFNCKECYKDKCILCFGNDIVISGICYPMTTVSHCISVNNSQCNQCGIGYIVNYNGTRCVLKIQIWVHIFFLVAIVVTIIFILMIIFYLLRRVYFPEEQQKFAWNEFIFDIRKKKYKFIENSEGLLINTQKLIFDSFREGIPVNVSSEKTFIIANIRKNPLKIDFILNQKPQRYKLTVNPITIILKKNEGCIFTFKVKPMCSCTINDQFTILYEDIRTNKIFKKNISVEAQTILSTLIDYEEITLINEIAQGSFSIVFKGKFRGNIVAIKRMKDLWRKDDFEEFRKEIDLLSKFKCSYIIQFLGAVINKNNISIITEYAPYGSCEQVMIKSNENPNLIPNIQLRIKIIKDISKAIQYLHSNGILHRDIKLANVLIISLEDEMEINAKLSDFGSSRSLNFLVNNITFTKGIGSPIYMAPEILQRKNYTTSADIYSLAISLFEIIEWKEAYPADDPKFKYQWQIAEYVCKGNRPQTIGISFKTKSLLDLMWCQKPENRISIDVVLKHLQLM